MSIARELTLNQNGMTAWLELLRRNFSPDIYLREYLVNSIQAIQRQNEGLQQNTRLTVSARMSPQRFNEKIVSSILKAVPVVRGETPQHFAQSAEC